MYLFYMVIWLFIILYGFKAVLQLVLTALIIYFVKSISSLFFPHEIFQETLEPFCGLLGVQFKNPWPVVLLFISHIN